MKNKNVNKIFIALILVFSLMITNVYAITITTGTGNIVTNTATLTVTGVNSTDTFAAYKVVDAYYDSNSNVISYNFTSAFNTFKNASTTYSSLTIDDYMSLTGGSITNGSSYESSELSALMAKYATYIRSNSVTGTGMTVSGNTASATLPAGGYLVLPTSTTKVYAVMVGNLDFQASSGEWVLNNEAIVAKVDDVSLTAYIGSSGNTSGTFRKNANFTNYVDFNLPVYPGDAINKSFSVTVTLPNGLDLVTNSFVVKLDGSNLVNNTDYTVTVNNKVATINFPNTSILNGDLIAITYETKLNNNAVLGSAGNKITYQGTYALDPYRAGSNAQTAQATTTAYTYGIKVYKYAGTNQSAPLENAVFYLCTSNACTSTTDSSYIATITTGSTGYGTFAGIEYGTFYLVEHSAPTGYRLLPSPIQVVVSSAGSPDSSGYYLSNISNTAQGVLPVTGGQGTILYTIVGLSVVVIGSIFIVYYRKKEEQLES